MGFHRLAEVKYNGREKSTPMRLSNERAQLRKTLQHRKKNEKKKKKKKAMAKKVKEAAAAKAVDREPERKATEMAKLQSKLLELQEVNERHEQELRELKQREAKRQEEGAAEAKAILCDAQRHYRSSAEQSLPQAFVNFEDWKAMYEDIIMRVICECPGQPVPVIACVVYCCMSTLEGRSALNDYLTHRQSARPEEVSALRKRCPEDELKRQPLGAAC